MTFQKGFVWLLLLLLLLTTFGGCGETGSQNDASPYDTVEKLAGKRIGVVTGTVFDGIARERISNPEISYFNADPDLPVALEAGKIDAYIADEPIYRNFLRSYPKQYQVEYLTSEAYGYIFPKNSERHETICRQLNDFLTEAWKNGTMNEITQKWLEGDPDNTSVDYSGLTGENGVLHYATCTESAAMFDMRVNDGYGGYEIDLLVRFCRAYGYQLAITDYSFSGLLTAVTSGKEDIGGCTVSITDERKESVLFSEPNYYGGSVLVATQSGSASDLTLSDMDGKRIGVVTGSVFDLIAKEKLPGGQIEYFNSMSDAATALQAGKVDAILADEPIYRSISRSYPQEYVIGQLTYEDYAYLFPKNSEKHTKLCAEMNAFLAEKWNDGTIGELCAKWIDGDYSKASIDISGLSGENGTLKMGISSDIGAPFTFVQNGAFAGYDIEIVVRFCREYGYALEISDYIISGLLSAVSTGTVDIAAGCVSVTEERKESMLFSDPNYHGGIVLVGTHQTVDENDTGFLARIRESFMKTFIREERWKLFVGGIGVTLLITALSVVFGSAAGFLFFLLYRKNFRPVNAVIDVIKDILEKTPVVVILMILYYLVFGQSDLSGVFVSVVGFSLMFAFSLVGTLKVGVMAVDNGQREASLALGFTDLRSFFKVILPQAAKHFLPGYKGQIVALLKDTAIVGYIAVQDLTKVSDIVRSRTYEAFFPLIATAVLYFLLAWLLTLLVRSLELKTDSKKRSTKKILRGVKTK